MLNTTSTTASPEPSRESSPIPSPPPILNQSTRSNPSPSSSQELAQTNLADYNETSNGSTSSSVNIDTIFINITKLYTEHDLVIIFHTLLLISKNPGNYVEYIEGLNKILEPINKQIQKWIVDNIVY